MLHMLHVRVYVCMRVSLFVAVAGQMEEYFECCDNPSG